MDGQCICDDVSKLLKGVFFGSRGCKKSLKSGVSRIWTASNGNGHSVDETNGDGEGSSLVVHASGVG